METANTNVNMSDGGSNTTVNTSSSINSSSSGSSSSQESPTNTSSYQTTNTGDTTEVEEYDLSLDESSDSTDTAASIDTGESTETGGEKPKKSIFSRVGDWFVDTAKSIYDTGAKVVHDVKTWCSENLLGPGNNLFETAANVAKNVFRIGAKVGELFVDAYTTVLSTGAVLLTTIQSGVGKLLEHVTDGVLQLKGNMIEGASWLLGSMVGWFNEDAGNWIKNEGHEANQAIKEYIARDIVGEINQWFYEQTPVGQYINEHSLMKYDSELAGKIRNVSEKAAEFAAATALTVFTGGAATFAIGALYGVGKSAEQTYQKNGTETSLLQEAMIMGSGVLSGLSWMATGKLGQGFLEIGKTAAEIGIKEVGSGLIRDIVSKDFWIKAFKEGLTGWNGVGNVASSAMMTGEEIIPYVNGTKEWTPEAVGKLALIFLGNLGLNVAEDALRGYVTDFDPNKLGKFNDPVVEDGSKVAEASEDAGKKAEKIGDETGSGNPDGTATTASTASKVDDGAEAASSVKKTLTDDEAIARAEDILDPNSTTGLKSLKDLDDESLKKVIDCMTPEELAGKLDTMDGELAGRIQKMFNEEEAARFAGQIAENISKGDIKLSDISVLSSSVRIEILQRTDLSRFSSDDMLKYFNDNKLWSPENAAEKEVLRQLMSHDDFAYLLNGGRKIRSDVPAEFINEDGTPKWPDDFGYEAGTRVDATIPEGTTIDRYGYEGGRFVGEYNPDGTPARFEQRSLPWTEETTGTRNVYHVTGDISSSTLLAKYQSSDPSGKVKVLAYIANNFGDSDVQKMVGISKKELSEILANSEIDADTIASMFENINLPVGRGKIAPFYGQSGGGIQIDFPVSIAILKKWGLVK